MKERVIDKEEERARQTVEDKERDTHTRSDRDRV